MIVKVSTYLNNSASRVWAAVKKSDTLVYVAKGLLSFTENTFPAEWKQGERVTARLWVFGLLPAGLHEIRFVLVDDERHEILTNERNTLIRVWNHRINIEPKTTNSCLYTDEIEIEAGVLTPVIWFAAQVFYRYRQSRWRRLAKSI